MRPKKDSLLSAHGHTLHISYNFEFMDVHVTFIATLVTCGAGQTTAMCMLTFVFVVHVQ